MADLAFNVATKFRKMATYRGFVIPEGDEHVIIRSLRVHGPVRFAGMTWQAAPWQADGKRTHFEIMALAHEEFDFATLSVEAELDAGGTPQVLSFDQAAIERSTMHFPYTVTATWQRLLDEEKPARMLDIGGRARSGESRKGTIVGTEISVADILPGEDVDIVADAHELSRHVTLPYDAFMSIATFEHLLMPWKAAVEINRVIRIGAIGLVATHQTLGLHDLPWDFYRYSDQAWKGIFNSFTGFEILDIGMEEPAFIMPFIWKRALDDAENAAGFMTSSVVVRKVSDPSVDWRVRLPEITRDLYPK